MRSTLAVLLLLAACGKRDEPEPKRELSPPRRVIEPPAQGVTALPPHAIRADGVGPYKLGEPAARLLDQLPSGPRITQFMLPGIVHRDILRAEGDAILIGAEPQGKSTFVAVVGKDIARTEGGIHVGSSRQELVKSLGAPLEDPDRAQDPHIMIPSGLRNLHCLIENGEVTAMVIAGEERSKEIVGETACTRPKGDKDLQKLGACLTGAGEIVRYTSDEIQVYAKDTDKLLDRKPVPNLVFAAAIRNPADGRDDVVTVSRAVESQSKTWSVAVFRVIDNKLTKIVDEPKLVLTAGNARWIGADLRDIDIYVELTGRGDTIEVGGLLTTRSNDKIRDIVVISPRDTVPVSRKRTKAQDAGTTEARAPGTDRAPR